MATSNTRPRPIRIIQNFHLVWLDENIDENNDDYHNSITKFRQIINTVNTFTDIDECIDFITTTKEMVFMIISEAFYEMVLMVTSNISNVSSIYIFSHNKMQVETSDKKFPKMKGIFTDVKLMCEALKQTAYECDHNAVSISFIKSTNTSSKKELDTLDCSFMYTQILKEILLTIDFNEVHINEFLTYCRENLDGNTSELKNVDIIKKEYRNHPPIWWYTYQSLLYSMVNRVLRLMEVDAIIKMGFFIRDLHEHITTLHAEQFLRIDNKKSFTLYRGQGLSESDFNQLRHTYGGLLAFNNFLSTSFDRAVSNAFAESVTDKPDLIGVLFIMKIDPSILGTPFANLKDISYFKQEEILFSMHSVFRIGEVKQLNGNPRLWQVQLALTSDNDPQLKQLTEKIQEETQGATGWLRLGKLLIKMAQFDKAEELYKILLKETTDQGEKSYLFHHLGSIKDNQGRYTEALEYYEKSLEILKKTLPAHHPDLATSYSNFGLVYNRMGEYSKALEYYEKDLEIKKKALPANHPDFASSYNNIGLVYDSMGEYSKALECYEKSLEIYQKTLSANHPDLASSYNNIGLVYGSMGEYSKALEYYEKSLEIYQKALPANHPLLATSYNNIGWVYSKMGEYSKALEYYEKSFEITKKTLPANHPDLASSYNNIGLVYDSMGEYSKALECYEKSLEICQKGLPANHPDLASSYNNIGLVYGSMGEYSKALECYEKSLEIYQKTLPANHPLLATSYNNIGWVYSKMGEYSKALEYYEKSFEITKKTLPANHPDLASSYNNIGLVYDSMGEYSKALECYEKSLEICQKGLPANHPDLASSYNNIGLVYDSMGEYSKALECYEKSLEIYQKTLPANHPLLATSYNNIGLVYGSMGECSKALEYYEKSLEITKKALPANHPDLASSYNNIGLVYGSMGEYSKALTYFECALNICQRSLPANHPHIKSVKESIEIVKKKL